MAMHALFGEFARTDDCLPLAARALGMVHELYPICRSITGDGVRATLARVNREVELEITEVASGTRVLDWHVPREWNIRDAYVADLSGRRVIDFRKHNLHVLGYSTPVQARMTLEELRPHLFSDPARPELIPYRTSYWKDNWGFCLSHRQFESLEEGEYDVCIDSELADGSLTYAECLVPGESSQEFLVSTHVCHPSLANDNCSGIAVAAVLAAALRARKPRLSYRFIFVPVTIGAVTWLALNRDRLARVRAGLVVGLLGDGAALTYKRSRRGSTEVDNIAAGVVREIDPGARVVDFSPYGYDERQYCSPGFDLPVGRLTRSPNDGYPEYHSSGDDLQVIQPRALAESLLALMRIIERVDCNRVYRNRAPHGEPRLGKHGLFRSTGGRSPAEFEHALLWMLNQADGAHGVQDTSARSGLHPTTLQQAVDALLAAGLLEEAS